MSYFLYLTYGLLLTTIAELIIIFYPDPFGLSKFKWVFKKPDINILFNKKSRRAKILCKHNTAKVDFNPDGKEELEKDPKFINQSYVTEEKTNSPIHLFFEGVPNNVDPFKEFDSGTDESKVNNQLMQRYHALGVIKGMRLQLEKSQLGKLAYFLLIGAILAGAVAAGMSFQSSEDITKIKSSVDSISSKIVQLQKDVQKSPGISSFKPLDYNFA